MGPTAAIEVREMITVIDAREHITATDKAKKCAREETNFAHILKLFDLKRPLTISQMPLLNPAKMLDHTGQSIRPKLPF